MVRLMGSKKTGLLNGAKDGLKSVTCEQTLTVNTTFTIVKLSGNMTKILVIIVAFDNAIVALNQEYNVDVIYLQIL